MIFLLAIRNLFAQFKNTIIIFTLTMLMIMLFFIGNTIISAAANGLRRTYILNYTGDIVIQAASENSMSIFGSNNPVIGEFFSIPVLKGYESILKVLDGIDGIEDRTLLISGPVAMTVDGKSFGSFAFGIEADTYFSVFPAIQLRAGEKLKPGERGAMITRERAAQIEEEIGRKLAPGDMILFTTASETGFKIQEVPLVGLFSYANASQIPTQIVLLDAQTARALNAILLAQGTNDTPPQTATDILTDNVDDIFSNPEPVATQENDATISLTELQAEIKKTQTKAAESWIGGSWNFIILRLKNNAAAGRVIEQMQKAIIPYSAQAVDWTTAAGTPALLVIALFYLFNGGFALFVIATMIAIINVVLISVFQRVREIGTLRAIGASNTFIWSLVVSENLMISFFAGVCGVVLGTAFILVINSLNLRIVNDLLTAMMGQNVVHFTSNVFIAATSILLALVLGLVSSIYPVAYALHIQPGEAVAKG